MRKFIITCLLINSCLNIFVETINSFEKPKDLYSLFYPEENITADTLINLEYYSGGGITKNKQIAYKGYLLKKKENSVLRVYPDPGTDPAPVWYFKLSKNIIYRRNQDFPRPSSRWAIVDLWISTVSLISLLPLLIYYLKLRKK